MRTESTLQNAIKNEAHYDKLYANVNINGILKKLNNFDRFFEDAIKTDTSWVGFYQDNFAEKIKGKKILELGCGDCTNAAVMAALGAKVYANDISQVSGSIIRKLNTNFEFEYPLTFVEGNFLEADLEHNAFDFIVGKAFVHHLTYHQEKEFTIKIVQLLKPNGIVRYFEPAVNSRLLDEIRWIIPVPGRPSKLLKKKFKAWEAKDPHPARDNSSKHYKTFGKDFFSEVAVVPIGGIQRFHRLLPNGKWNRKFRRVAFQLEKVIPHFMHLPIARSQVITYTSPKKISI
ncbi:MAG: class I SAM-dependent methyltransferase [Altibacter sp.]|uniref:class I SAM-dependent methyltransferase n=1 Tax=Altibacter sp. TaxID=2024823 RepID=UPI001DAB74B7|nr:class I SAM-dependent methyltransferase [Altibacter sp.]MBZ0327899.1 class I SAM-dependent methyltransferase [Altibacter sp.]